MLITAATKITEAFLVRKQAKAERERYESNDEDREETTATIVNVDGDVSKVWLFFLPVIIGIVIVEVAIGSFAVYLSWTSNTLIEWGAFAKVVFAFFAFINGLGYLITHLFNKLDLVMYVRKMRRSMAQLPLPMPAVFVGGAAKRGSKGF